MDRRLPIRPDTWSRQIARRELALEQRLDQLLSFRPRSQRFLNPPCCADTEPPPMFPAYYLLNLASLGDPPADRTLDTAVDPPESDGITLPTPMPAGAILNTTPPGMATGPTIGDDGVSFAFCGITEGLANVDLFTCDLADPLVVTPGFEVTTVETYVGFRIRFFPAGLDSSTVQGFGWGIEMSSTVDYGTGDPPPNEFNDTWPDP